MGSYLLSVALIVCMSMVFVNTQNNSKPGFFERINRGIGKEIQEIKAPIESTLVYIGSSQCSNVKKLVGVSYEQIEGEKEPDLNELSLDYISSAFSVSYNLSAAAEYIPQARGFNSSNKLFIFIHGFTDDPTQAGFTTIKEALFKSGENNVLALDASSLIKWLYLRSSTYIRFIGEKLGAVLAAMVESGLNPESVHVIGHSLGAHISGFTGKTFANLTGYKIGRISGLDPAGPCFSHVDDDVRLNATDANFVDVIHTDGGVFGLIDPVGDVDYYPNDGMQQPNCLFQSCSHSRAWHYFAESCTNPEAFPAVKCDDYEAFKKGEFDDNDISYMGLPTEPTAYGKYYLQTGEDSPYGLGKEGIQYKNTDGLTKRIAGGAAALIG